ncbi:MAG: hypothetical protein OQJ97_05375 [Rhodospirillales bacterium]|nr:hypothetical protein [Rhodospirillales bacterium]
MHGFLLPVLKLFGFNELQTVIALLSMLYFLAAFFGGLLSGIAKAYGAPRAPIPLSQKISFRIILLGAIMMIFFIFYYHFGVTGNFNASHGVYWTSTMIAGPLIGMLGNAIIEAIFSGKIKKNEKIYKAWADKQRAKAFAKRRAAVREGVEEVKDLHKDKARRKRHYKDREENVARRKPSSAR